MKYLHTMIFITPMSTELGYDENTNNIKYLIDKETWPRADDDVYNVGLELEDDDVDIGFDDGEKDYRN